MSDHTPHKSSLFTRWLIWMTPVVSIIFAGYLVFQEYGNRGPVIEITFENGSGLEAQKTPIVCRGIKIGIVESADLHSDLEHVTVRARLDQSAASLASEGSKFWIVRPKISLDGITGLDTLVSGAYITVAPGDGGEQRNFQGLEEQPSLSDQSIQYLLRTPTADSVHPGIPVTFRGFPVGEVISVDLSPQATDVIVRIAIEAEYQRLIREGVVFWNESGVNMKVGLLGAKISTGSLQSLLSGSISLALPPEAADADLVPVGSEFPLHPEAEKDWEKWIAPIKEGDNSSANTAPTSESTPPE